MHKLMKEPIDVLRQQLHGEHPVDEDVLTSVAVLADRLEALKTQHPMFYNVGFSPDIEAVVMAHTALTVN